MSVVEDTKPSGSGPAYACSIATKAHMRSATPDSRPTITSCMCSFFDMSFHRGSFGVAAAVVQTSKSKIASLCGISDGAICPSAGTCFSRYAPASEMRRFFLSSALLSVIGGKCIKGGAPPPPPDAPEAGVRTGEDAPASANTWASCEARFCRIPTKVASRLRAAALLAEGSACTNGAAASPTTARNSFRMLSASAFASVPLASRLRWSISFVAVGLALASAAAVIATARS